MTTVVKPLMPKKVAQLKRLAERIDHEDQSNIKTVGCAVFDGHEHLREAVTRLRVERERQGLSLGDVSERAGIGLYELAQLESFADGKPLGLVSLASLMRYAEALGRTLHLAVA